MLLIIGKLPLVCGSVWLDENSEPVHVVGVPAAEVLSPVLPEVTSVSLDLILVPLAYVGALIAPDIDAYSFLPTEGILTVETSTINPFLLTSPMLLIVSPLPLVRGTSRISEDAMPVRFIIGPTTFIHVTVSMVNRSVAECLVMLPVAFILGPITPLHSALSVSQASKPLSVIHGTALVDFSAG